MKQHDQQLFTRYHILLIALAVVLGACIRLVDNNQPFYTSDHAQLASVVTFFYPRNLAMLVPSHTSSWNMLTNPHGVLPSVIGITSMTVVGLTGMHITEFWWNLPFVLINLLPIPLSAVLLARIGSRNAGVLAAFLLAILPLHASLSRASGLNIPVALDCHFATVLAFVTYYGDPTPRNARIASLALAVNLTVEVLFPILLTMVFAIGLLSVKTSKPLLFMRIHRVRALMFAPRVMLLPFAIICINFFMLIAYVNGWTSFGGLAARMLEGSDRQPGVYPGDFWNNASYAIGTIALPLLLALGATGLPALWRLEKRAVPLMWSVVYLLPFLVFTRPHVYEYFLFGLAPLTVHASLVLASWWEQARWQRWLARVTLPILAGLFVLRLVSMVFGVDVVPAVGTGQAPGGIFADQGLKAAAWWVREHSSPDDMVFADSAFEPYQIWYYTHRPFLAVTDAKQPDEAYLLLETEPNSPTWYLVVPENVPLLEQYADPLPFHVATVVEDTDSSQPLVYMYSTTERAHEVVERTGANRQFDEQFGTWRAMFAIGTRQ